MKRALTVAENALFWAELSGRVRRSGQRRIGALRAPAEIGDLQCSPALGGPGTRRLSLTRLLVADRPIWLLDEPAESLDAASRTLLTELIGEQLQSGGIVLAASHYDFGHEFARELKLGGKAGAGS